ncbi:hypothetical protein G9C98_007579 [Cotesia typhae]|uniref:Uncharacterized protein n=2 Tax=Cotesia typhae TaxID=2053667 RepID=A0A8J5V6L8_9HYME|nr:hypothetical protein G9C98_007579 [Cotesia typhae]
MVSLQIGKKYFNLLAPPCFTYDYPIKECVLHQGMIRRKCVEYEVDFWALPTWQWRDNKLY